MFAVSDKILVHPDKYTNKEHGTPLLVFLKRKKNGRGGGGDGKVVYFKR